jgi:hypothetical protein
LRDRPEVLHPVSFDRDVFLEGLIPLGAGDLDHVVTGGQVVDLLGQGSDLLVVDVELHAALGSADMDAGALGGCTEGDVHRRVLVRLDSDRLQDGRIVAIGEDLDLVGACRDVGDRARGGVALLAPVHEDVDAIDRGSLCVCHVD